MYTHHKRYRTAQHSTAQHTSLAGKHRELHHRKLQNGITKPHTDGSHTAADCWVACRHTLTQLQAALVLRHTTNALMCGFTMSRSHTDSVSHTFPCFTVTAAQTSAHQLCCCWLTLPANSFAVTLKVPAGCGCSCAAKTDTCTQPEVSFS